MKLPAFYRLVAYETIDSTNDEARRLAAAGAAEGTLIWAREQRLGRGRRGRTWVSPPGNLYVSLILRPSCAPAVAAQVSFVAAVALAEALADLLPPAATVALKWPNDVLVGGAKVAGILLETQAAATHVVEWLIAGIGVNVAGSPADTAYPATCLLAEGAPDTGAEAVLAALASSFDVLYRTWRTAGFAPVRAAWMSRARGLGEPIEVRLERDTLHGRFVDLDDTGALVLEMPDGACRQITAGELFFPRV